MFNYLDENVDWFLIKHGDDKNWGRWLILRKIDGLLKWFKFNKTRFKVLHLGNKSNCLGIDNYVMSRSCGKELEIFVNCAQYESAVLLSKRPM